MQVPRVLTSRPGGRSRELLPRIGLLRKPQYANVAAKWTDLLVEDRADRIGPIVRLGIGVSGVGRAAAAWTTTADAGTPTMVPAEGTVTPSAACEASPSGSAFG
jgi:hypothetical protein